MSLNEFANSGFGVSIIIPCYNYGEYLSEAIDSALKQDYNDYEVIVVDDGSSDDSGDVAKSYGEKLKYVSQFNQGLSATRNNGIKLSTKNFVCFLDADDRLTPVFISSIMEKFRQLPDEYALVACLDKKIGKSGLPIEDRYHTSITGELTTKDLILKNRFFPAAAIIRKDVFKLLGGFDTDLKSSEDRDMWIRISSCYKLYLCCQRLVEIRKHGENMSSNANRMRENKLAVIKKAYAGKYVSRANVFFWLKCLSILHYQVGWIFHNQGNKVKSITSLLISTLYWPFEINPRKLDVPILYRIRAMFRFLFG